MKDKTVAKKIDDPQLDPDDSRLCLLEFTADDILNELINFKQELKSINDKHSETKKTVDHLLETLNLIKNQDITDLSSFKKISQDLYNFQSVFNNQKMTIMAVEERITKHQNALSDVVKELEQLKDKIVKKNKTGKLLEFKR